MAEWQKGMDLEDLATLLRVTSSRINRIEETLDGTVRQLDHFVQETQKHLLNYDEYMKRDEIFRQLQFDRAASTNRDNELRAAIEHLHEWLSRVGRGLDRLKDRDDRKVTDGLIFQEKPPKSRDRLNIGVGPTQVVRSFLSSQRKRRRRRKTKSKKYK